MTTAKVVFFALMLSLAGPALAADLDALKADCDSCHGPLGVSTQSNVPIIAGQTPEFIAKTLRGFQMWDRPCIKVAYPSGPRAGTKTDMCKLASSLGDDDISALGAWYGQQVFVPAKQDFDPALATAGEQLHAADCEKCHEQGGSLPARGPRLAGQWTGYLSSTIKFVPTGEYMCPPMMERKIAGYDKVQISQLLNYYASKQE
jgi:sulfide dehydrogenase cytochrome subunit